MSSQSTITNNYIHFTYPQIFTFHLHSTVKENKHVSTLHANAQYEKSVHCLSRQQKAGLSTEPSLNNTRAKL